MGNECLGNFMLIKCLGVLSLSHQLTLAYAFGQGPYHCLVFVTSRANLQMEDEIGLLSEIKKRLTQYEITTLNNN